MKNLKLQLRELAARSERVVELASNWVGPSGVNSKGQRPEDNWRRGAGMGLLIGGVPGAILTQPLASKSAENKVIYRKRDAATDSLRIAGGGLAGGMLGSVAGRLAARGSAGPSLLPLVGNIAGLGAGLFGGYKWAKGASENRINEARVDRVKTGMASAYLNDQMKKRNARTAAVSDSQGYVISARRPDNE
jgi:hypothetical protein